MTTHFWVSHFGSARSAFISLIALLCQHNRLDEMKRIRWTINLNLSKECSIWWTIIWECKVSIGMLYFQCHFKTTNDLDIFFSDDVSIAQKWTLEHCKWLTENERKSEKDNVSTFIVRFMSYSIAIFTVFGFVLTQKWHLSKWMKLKGWPWTQISRIHTLANMIRFTGNFFLLEIYTDRWIQCDRCLWVCVCEFEWNGKIC